MVSLAAQDKLDQILSEAVANKVTPALFFAAADKDGLLFSRQVGTQILGDSSSQLIHEDTIFWLCSMTKLVTSIATLQLVEQQKIAFDTLAKDILPELANPVVVTAHDASGKPVSSIPAKADITVGQLLNHTSGIDYAIDGTTPTTGPLVGVASAYMHNYKGEDVSAFFKLLEGDLPGIPLRFEPGTNFAYGYSSDCAGFIVERLSGKSLEQYFQDHIFAPLGITSMSFHLTPAMKERLIPLSTRKADGGLELVDLPPVISEDPVVYLGGIGLYGSLKDYLTLIQHLLQIKTGHSVANPILSRASVDALFKPTLPPVGAETLSAVTAFLFPHLGMPAGAAQFSRGLLLNTAAIPGQRGGGSGGGWANTVFWIDSARGIAAVMGTQMSPPCDDAFMRIYSQLEKELYMALEAV